MTLDWNGATNNGNLHTATYNNGGPGYPVFLTFTQSYGYDNVNRINSVSDSGGWSRTFQMDAYGNTWVKSNSGVPLAGNTPTSNVYTAANQISGGSYDNAGNQTVVNGNTLAYDAENRQVSETDGVTHAVATYLYDGDGHRVSKAGPGGTTVYVYDALGQLTAEYSTANSSFPCTTCYLSADHLGSTRLVTDSTATVIARHDYLPFGEEIPANTAGRDSHWGPGNDTVNQKFIGKERDQETGLDYFGARYYGSALERFSSADDPFENWDQAHPQTLNLYSYANNNPLNSVDPDGRNVRVCVLASDQKSYSCWVMTDQEYQKTYNINNDKNGVSLPTPAGVATGGLITCSGQVCGSADFTDPGIQDESGAIGVGVLGGKAAEGLLESVSPTISAWVGRILGRSGTEAATGSGASGLGDLTAAEVAQIQKIVDAAGRPLEVVGSAAKGARTAASDIDYVAPPSSHPYLQPLQEQLPGIDPAHGMVPGTHNPYIGPAIRFEPGAPPRYIPMTNLTK